MTIYIDIYKVTVVSLTWKLSYPVDTGWMNAILEMNTLRVIKQSSDVSIHMTHVFSLPDFGLHDCA